MLEKQEYIGTFIGGYRLIAEVATNYSSRTFLGETASLTDHQRVVIKWYHTTHLTTQQKKKNFLREARLLKYMQQPFILPILATGLFIDMPYIVTPYMNKGSLSDRMQNPAGQAWLQKHASEIIEQIGQGLAYSHQQNVVHGRLHPRNILFNACDEVQLVDFQLSATSDGQSANPLGKASQENDLQALQEIAQAIAHDTVQQQSDIQADDPSTRNFSPLADIETNPQLNAVTKAIIVKSIISQTTGGLTQNAIFPAKLYTNARRFPQMSMVPPTPLLAAVTSNSDLIKTWHVPDKPKRTRRERFSRLLRDQGSIFLILGVLCIMLFSFIGVQFMTMHRTRLLQETKTHALVTTATALPPIQPIPSSVAGTASVTVPTSVPTDVILLLPTVMPTVAQEQAWSAQLPKNRPSSMPRMMAPSHNQSPSFSIAPASLQPKTCPLKNGYYTCTVMLALGADAPSDQAWSSTSSSSIAFASPSSGMSIRGSQMPIVIRIAASCAQSGTITFTGSQASTTLNWSC